MPSFKVILNPAAGRGYGAKTEPKLRGLLDAAGIDYHLERTTGPGHAAELAEQAVGDGFDIVVAAGGDGTTHEVVNGLMAAADGQAGGILGFIPVGNGSDFAHSVGIPSDLRAACRRLSEGQVRIVDIGRVVVDREATRYFDNTVGIGFDGVAVLEALRFKRLRGLVLYLSVIVKTIFLSLKATRTTIQFDDETLARNTMMICIANGPREGGSFLVAPDARPDDGIFELLIAGEVSKLTMLGLIPHFMRGTHVGRGPITMARGRRVVISSPDALVAHADGEILCTDAHRIECQVLPRSLQVWV